MGNRCGGCCGSKEIGTEQFRGKPRLPKLAVPKRYDIRLQPDLIACEFTGSVCIDLDVVVPDTKFIVLNAADLVVDSASVTFTHRDSAQVYLVDKMELVVPDEILVLEFKKTLPLGMGILAMNFNGFLNDKLKGFYRSTYELKGEKKNMAVTQFEPVDARRCFPCWDEPAFKAAFKITLDVPLNSELVALSNMPIDEEETNGDLKTVSYKETPIMSTYLVAIVIGAFDYVEEQTSDGIKVRVYCQVGKANQGKFALDVAVKTLKIYEEYFATRYALPKLDMVAIPDLAYGAMENYGLITYREADLLIDDQHSAAGDKQRVAIVVAHEVAHQWFGNLVTMEWWTHLWLNEGFATWLSYHALDQLFPQWKIWSQFLDITADGLRLDALEGSHPIEVEINHASESEEIFDAISYKKGASVIRMLHNHLGEERFKRSIASYIKKYASSNAKTEDLWAVLEEGSGEPVTKIMNSWTKKKGFPVVSVTVKDQKLQFEQSQFLSSGIQPDEHWVVPITLCCGTIACDVRKNFLLLTKSKTVNVKHFLGSNLVESANAWIKLNVNQTGFYRVKYEENLMARLRSAIKEKYLTETDRFGLLEDSFALCMARHQSLTTLLTLMDAYQKESDYSVLTMLINITCKIEAIAAEATTPELLSYIKQFFIDLLQNSAEKLGWDAKHGESHLESMLRGEVLMELAFFGHGPTLSEASMRFQTYLKDRNTPLLPPDIRKAAYVAVMQQVSASDRSGYESLLKVYREADLSQEKARILSSLATCRDAQMLREFLDFLLSAEVRRQDAFHGLNVSQEGYETAWTWLQVQWDHIWKTWGSGVLINRFVSSIVSPLASFEKAKEVKAFFASRSNPSIARTWKQSVEQVRINAKWVQSIQNEEKLAETLKKLSQRSN